MLPVRIDEPLLREIAAKTGGRYFRARDSEALSRIFRQIDQLEKTPIQVTRYTKYEEATRPLVAARARRAGARAAARQHAGGAGPMIFDAPLLLVPGAVPRAWRWASPRGSAGGAASGWRGLVARAGPAGAARGAWAPLVFGLVWRSRRSWRWRGRAGAGREIRHRVRALSLVFAVDISRSMLAEDAAPNRLQRAVREARRLIQDLEGDRLGLIAFAGRSYILAPLTVDGGAIRMYLDALDPDLASEGGTNLASVLAQGAELLGATTDAADRVLVVFTDGEAHDTLPDVVPAGRGAQGGGRPADHGGGGRRRARRGFRSATRPATLRRVQAGRRRAR